MGIVHIGFILGLLVGLGLVILLFEEDCDKSGKVKKILYILGKWGIVAAFCSINVGFIAWYIGESNSLEIMNLSSVLLLLIVQILLPLSWRINNFFYNLLNKRGFVFTKDDKHTINLLAIIGIIILGLMCIRSGEKTGGSFLAVVVIGILIGQYDSADAVFSGDKQVIKHALVGIIRYFKGSQLCIKVLGVGMDILFGYYVVDKPFSIAMNKLILGGLLGIVLVAILCVGRLCVNKIMKKEEL